MRYKGPQGGSLKGMRNKAYRVLAGSALLAVGLAWAAGRVADAWAIPAQHAWAAVLLSVLVLWVFWHGLGFDARLRRRRRLLNLRLRDLDRLSGAAFEDWIAAVLQASGWRIEHTPRTGDYGVDLIASKGEARIGIEAKRRQGPISNHVVRSVVAGCQYHGCNRAAVVTQSTFTRQAVAQAEGAAVEVTLLGRSDLDRLPELLIR